MKENVSFPKQQELPEFDVLLGIKDKVFNSYFLSSLS